MKFLRRTPAPLRVLLACLTLLLSPFPVTAADYTLSNCDAATLVSNFSNAANSPANDTITLKAGCTYTLTQGFTSATAPATASPDNAFRVLTAGKGTLTIIGNGARIERSSAAGIQDFRFFQVETGGTLILSNLTLANGSFGDGGAIFNDGGTVTLRNVTITGNQADGVGGGVANATSRTTGLLTIINSTLSGNSAGDSGGALYSDGTVHVVNSTLSSNSALFDGGGIYHTANVSNSLTLVQSTLTANSAGRNGGNLYTGQTTTLHNVILADSANGGECYKSGSPAITLVGAALVEDGSCGLSGAGYLNVDPLLGPLVNNGGATLTHALPPASRAIDAGSALPTDTYDADGDNNTGEPLPVDQRGQTRVIGSAVDLGAFELQQPFVTNVSASTADGTYGIGSTIEITVTFNQPVQVTGAPQLQLETGEADAVAIYTSGNGTTVLTFTYTVATGHTSTDLDYTNSSALILTGGTIQTSDGTPALLALPKPGTTGSLGANKALVIVTESVEPDPTVTIEQAAAQTDPTNTDPVQFTVVFSAPVSGFSGDGVDLTGSTAPGTLTASVSPAAPNDGTTYTVSVSGMTGDGQVVASVKAGAALSAAMKPNSASTSADNTVIYDVTAPDTALTAAPPLITANSTVIFTFSSEAGATFECSFSGAAYAACTSPASYSALADGDYTFAVRAADSVGNSDATPASTSFTVDTTAPDTFLDSTPPAVTNDSTPAFSFSSPESSATFECKLNDGVYFACATPYAMPPLADGPHTFAVRAVDAAGNTDATPAEYSFTVDAKAPTVEISSSAANPTNLTPITIMIRFSEPVSGFEVADLLIGNGSPGELTSAGGQAFTVAIAPTFDGIVSVTIAASVVQDAAGNGNSALTSRFDITYDSTAPNTTITSPDNDAFINYRRPAFVFSANESGATFTCTLDKTSFPCESPYTYVYDLADGNHSFSVAASDAAGNTDATPASIQFTVDTFAPEIYLGATPGDPTRTSSVTIGFTSPESSVTFECRLGSGDFTACSSPFRATLADARYTFYVRAVDLAGNRSIALSYSFTVDTIAPDVSISEPADGQITKHNTPRFVFGSTDTHVTFTCRIDANAFTACTSPFTPTAALAEGERAFEVQARDQAGNSALARVTITVDTVAPDTTLDTTPLSITTSNEARFAFSGNESGVRFECSLDSAAFTICESPHTTGALGNGEHYFQVRAIDLAGNSDPTPAAFVFVVDTDTPETSLDAAPDGTTSASTPTFSFSSPDSSASFECKLDSGDYSSCQSPHTTGALADGGHTFSVRAVDSAGNRDATPASVTFTVDATAPTVTSIQRLDASPTNRDSVAFSVQLSEAVTGVDETAFTLTVEGLAGAAITSVTGSGGTYTVTISTGSGDGTLRLDVRADAAIRDAGNQPLISGYTSGESYTVVRTGPIVESIIYTLDRDALVYTVTFSAPVSGVDESDFALSANGIDAALTSVSGAGETYTVVITWSGVGTLALNVTDDDSIRDDAENPLGGTGTGNGDFQGPTFDSRPHDDDNDHDDHQDDETERRDAENHVPAASGVPAALLLSDIDASTNPGLRAEVPAGASIFGRVLVMDTQFYVSGAHIGNAEVLARGVIAAVDVFSPSGSEVAGTRICLRGAGTLLFLDGRTSPRQLLTLETTREVDMTCGVLPAAGTVVLVAS